MIDHTGIGVADVARSAEFYDSVCQRLSGRVLCRVCVGSRRQQYGGGLPGRLKLHD